MKLAIFIILVFLTPIAFALTQFDFWRNLLNPSNKEYNRDWHGYQWLSMLCCVAFGYVLDVVPWSYYPLIAVVFWTLSDGIQNGLKGRSFFYISTQTTDVLNNVSQWYVKLPLIGILTYVAIIWGK